MYREQFEDGNGGDIGELAERQHRAAENETERPAYVAHQREECVGSRRLGVRPLQFGEEHLRAKHSERQRK